MAEDLVEQALAQLDLETKARLLAGQDMWSLPAVPEIGLRSVVMSDGPIGVRGSSFSRDQPSIALPSPTALAATWDVALARRAGRLLAGEARRKGVDVVLGPTVNLHRSPLGGRHFECYSEDPLLTGEIAAGWLAGLQECGVAGTVKHFVANDSETERMTVDIQVGERALRELYLAPFETVVAKAGPFAIMAAYNRVNGPTMTEHRDLLTTVLRQEWGFDGVVVSDWLAARDTVGAATGGLDVAMPGPRTVFGPHLARAVRAGAVSERLVDDMVRRVLRLAARVGALAGAAPVVEPPPVDGQALAREVAANSFVLLRNDNLLPLAADTKVALIGSAAQRARVLGGGSATVYPSRIVSPLAGLREAGVAVTFASGADPATKLAPARDGFELRAVCRDAAGSVLRELPLPEGSVRWIGMLPAGLSLDQLHTVEITGTFTPAVGGAHRLAVDGIGQFRLTVGGQTLFDGISGLDADPDTALFGPPQRIVEVDVAEPVTVSLEHTVRPLPGIDFPVISLALGHGDPIAPADELIAEAVAAAAAADVAVVVVATTEEVECEGRDRTSLALPGRQDELVARVAGANPRTVVVVNSGSPVELPWRDRVAAILLVWFPGQEAGHAIADVLLGHTEPGGRLPTTWPAVLADAPVVSTTPQDGVLRYDEGVFIGYRGWDRSGTTPAFGFGHGLGYTEWTYESAVLTGTMLTVRLRNIGGRAGREVVQAYLSPATPDPSRPARWLAGFAVGHAEPGEVVETTIAIPHRAFEIWDNGWQTVPGDYLLNVGHSLTDTRLTVPLSLATP